MSADADLVRRYFAVGKALLSAQSFEIRESLAGGSEICRAGHLARHDRPLGSEWLPAGTELVADIAAFLTVAGGRIRQHETFDCYEPF